ncbi:hypothetical protein Tco_1098736, partial [Tanacetum coccineum]
TNIWHQSQFVQGRTREREAENLIQGIKYANDSRNRSKKREQRFGESFQKKRRENNNTGNCFQKKGDQLIQGINQRKLHTKKREKDNRKRFRESFQEDRRQRFRESPLCTANRRRKKITGNDSGNHSKRTEDNDSGNQPVRPGKNKRKKGRKLDSGNQVGQRFRESFQEERAAIRGIVPKEKEEEQRFRELFPKEGRPIDSGNQSKKTAYRERQIQIREKGRKRFRESFEKIETN